jgi:hypothetical protein
MHERSRRVGWGARLALLAAAVAFAQVGTAAAQTGTKVLEYDKSGKAKVRSQDLNEGGVGGPNQPYFTNDTGHSVDTLVPLPVSNCR